MVGALAFIAAGCAGGPAAVFPGTDVPYQPGTAGGGGAADTGLCVDYASTLDALVDVADVILVATVTGETPVFEPVYGTAVPRENEDGELPPVAEYSLARSLTIEIDTVLTGDAEPVTSVAAEGWQYNDRTRTWVVDATYGSNRLEVGDRAVLPLFAEDSPMTYWPSHTVACTGAFIIRDGQVNPRTNGTGQEPQEFRAEGPRGVSAYTMSEAELVAAIRSAADG